MFRPRCAPLRRLLIRRPLLPACSAHLRTAAVSAAAVSASAQPQRTPAPALASSRSFSSSPTAAVKNDGHFPKDLYDSIAECTMDGILMSLEMLAERRADIDVEYSSGVLTLTTPRGTYVINKQPPNRQLWLSSPVSGPFRYNWDHARMVWVSAKGDGSTLSGVLRKEVGIEYDISLPIEG